MCLVHTAAVNGEQNCMAYQLGSNIFYNTTRDIGVGEELLVWYTPTFAKKLGKPPEPDSSYKGKCLVVKITVLWKWVLFLRWENLQKKLFSYFMIMAFVKSLRALSVLTFLIKYSLHFKLYFYLSCVIVFNICHFSWCAV